MSVRNFTVSNGAEFLEALAAAGERSTIKLVSGSYKLVFSTPAVFMVQGGAELEAYDFKPRKVILKDASTFEGMASQIFASGDSKALVFGRGSVFASDRAYVDAHDAVFVDVRDTATVRAYDTVETMLYDNAACHAHNHSLVMRESATATVYAHGPNVTVR